MGTWGISLFASISGIYFSLFFFFTSSISQTNIDTIQVHTITGKTGIDKI